MRTARLFLALGVTFLGAGLACSAASDSHPPPVDTRDDTGDPHEVAAPSRSFVAVTFNTGTTEGLIPEDAPPGAYTRDHARVADEYYGNGLAWPPAIEKVTEFFAEVRPDVVVFQEIFWTGECPDIPPAAQEGFVCEAWQEGDPTVAQMVLGEDYQVCCHPKRPDKCAAVHHRFGRFRGCEADFCPEGLDGFHIQGCGGGARIGRGTIDLVGGGTLTLVNIHGSSGIRLSDQQCRIKQFDQVFVDLGDEEPGANGDVNLIMGDLNTDPARLAGVDPSADRFNELVGEGKPFRFVTEVGPDVAPTYPGIMGISFNIDHVVTDKLDGSCWAAGVTPGYPPVMDTPLFDHTPIVCDLTFPD